MPVQFNPSARPVGPLEKVCLPVGQSEKWEKILKVMINVRQGELASTEASIQTAKTASLVAIAANITLGVGSWLFGSPAADYCGVPVATTFSSAVNFLNKSTIAAFLGCTIYTQFQKLWADELKNEVVSLQSVKENVKDPMFAHFAAKRFVQTQFSLGELQQVSGQYQSDTKEAYAAYLTQVPPFKPFYEKWVNKNPYKLLLNPTPSATP